MKIEEVLIRVQRQFGDESGVQIQNDDVIRWVNDAQKEVVMQHDNLLQALTTMDSVANIQQYAVPELAQDIQSIDYMPTNGENAYSLQFMSTKALNEYIPGWKNTLDRGAPTYYTRGFEEGNFAVYPIPDLGVVDGFSINHSRYATPVVNLGDNIDLPGYYDTYVTEYCLMKAYEMDESWDAADRKAAYVQSTIDFNNARESQFSKDKYTVIAPSIEDYI